MSFRLVGSVRQTRSRIEIARLNAKRCWTLAERFDSFQRKEEKSRIVCVHIHVSASCAQVSASCSSDLHVAVHLSLSKTIRFGSSAFSS